MLVLSRKVDEAIILGEDIKITVLGLEDDRVRIGIDAPKDVRIFREELFKQTADINKQAMQPPKFDLKNVAKKGE